jgi:DNA-binding transcriptional MerR regulator
VIIGELSERTGVNTWSLRHYDRAGLLTSTRAPNHYRDFPESAVREVTRIRCLLSVGFNLHEVKQVMPYIGHGGRIEANEKVRQLIDTRLRSLDDKMAVLDKVRQVLRGVSDELRLRAGADPSAQPPVNEA